MSKTNGTFDKLDPSYKNYLLTLTDNTLVVELRRRGYNVTCEKQVVVSL